MITYTGEHCIQFTQQGLVISNDAPFQICICVHLDHESLSEIVYHILDKRFIRATVEEPYMKSGETVGK